MKLLILLLALCTTDSLLQVYDHEIEMTDTYLESRQARIDSLRTLPCSPQQQLQLAELYRPYQSDSATACLYRVMESSPEYEVEARIRLLQLFSSIGMFVEGFNLESEITEVPDSLRMVYFEAVERLYSWSSGNCKSQVQKKHLANVGRQYLDSLNAEAMRQPMGHLRLNAVAMRYRHNGNYTAALQVNDSIFALIAPDSHEYALYAYQRYLIHKDMQQNELAEQWLIRSAITDVRCGVTDNGASWVLANWLFQKGDMERANRYMEYSLSNVAFYNAPIRSIQINRLAHTIMHSYQSKQQILTNYLRIGLIITIIILLLLIALFVYSVRQYRVLHRLSRKQKHLNIQLETLNDKQEKYIGHFLAVYSEYIRRLSKMARRAGERDTDIFLTQEMQKFYNTFDETFLSLYPDFVSQFNALLLPEGQILPTEPGKLTTELRIYAWVCLGIDNVSQIAELLCYSPSTIYNYRVRIKNAAIGDRDTFEERVRQIPQTSK